MAQYTLDGLALHRLWLLIGGDQHTSFLDDVLSPSGEWTAALELHAGSLIIGEGL